MKFNLKSVVILIVAFQLVSFVNVRSDSVESEFKELNDSRKERKLLVEYLVKQKLAIESPNGILKLSEKLDASSREILESENENRMSLFFLIAESEKRSPIKVGREFYEKRFGKVDEEELIKPKFNRLMRMDGSQVIGTIVAPELVEGFLKQNGYIEVRQETEGLTTKVIGRLPSSLPTHYDFVEIQSKHTAAAFSSEQGFGLLGQYCDIGMASRQVNQTEVRAMKAAGLGDPLRMEHKIGVDGLAFVVHPSNQIKALSLYHIGLCYSGNLTKWSDLGYKKEAVKLILPHSSGGTSDIFNYRLMKGFNLYLSSDTSRFADFKEITKAVSQQSGAMGLLSFAQISDDVKPLSITMANGAYSVEPLVKHVRSQGYPLSRPLYFYLSKQSNEMARNFVEFAVSDQGQAIVNEAGFVGRAPAAEVKQQTAVNQASEISFEQEVEAKFRQLTNGASRSETPWNLRFSQGSDYRLSESSVADFNSLYQFLAKPENKKIQVILIGFTDSVGNEWENQKLSKNRADVVAAKIRDWGVSDVRTAGFGEVMPIGDNNTPEGRNKNRRVEIWIKR